MKDRVFCVLDFDEEGCARDGATGAFGSDEFYFDAVGTGLVWGVADEVLVDDSKNIKLGTCPS